MKTIAYNPLAVLVILGAGFASAWGDQRLLLEVELEGEGPLSRLTVFVRNASDQSVTFFTGSSGGGSTLIDSGKVPSCLAAGMVRAAISPRIEFFERVLVPPVFSRPAFRHMRPDVANLPSGSRVCYASFLVPNDYVSGHFVEATLELPEVGTLRTQTLSLGARTRIESLARECEAGGKESCRELGEIAKNDESPWVRAAAVERLMDQTVLADIVKTDKDTGVRLAAVLHRLLTDQAVLAELATNAEDYFVRKAAVEKLTDQGLLADIAKKDENGPMRETAVGRLTDQALLADIAKTDRDFHVREAAVRKLTDQAVLVEIAKNDKTASVRIPAAEKLNDYALAQLVYADIVVSTGLSWQDRYAAAKHLEDPTLVQPIYEEVATRLDVIEEVRKDAVQRLTNRTLLEQLARSDRKESVRDAAKMRLRESQERR